MKALFNTFGLLLLALVIGAAWVVMLTLPVSATAAAGLGG